MKYLAIICTIIVLALSVWPCCNDEANTELKETRLSSVEEPPCNTNETQHTCSPFFHCSSCQAFAITPVACKTTSTVLIRKDIRYSELPAPAIIRLPGDIWQPPQLG